MNERKSWLLTDTDAGIWTESFAVEGASTGSGRGWSVRKRTLRGGLSDGVDLVEVDNGAIGQREVLSRSSRF